jgi:hypothetical protein
VYGFDVGLRIQAMNDLDPAAEAEASGFEALGLPLVVVELGEESRQVRA